MDALWFCYSPVHQMTEYYRYGKVDDCLGHWGELWDCLKQRTKFADTEARAQDHSHPLWKLRTKEEAAQFWKKEFGHLDESSATLPPRDAGFTVKSPCEQAT